MSEQVQDKDQQGQEGGAQQELILGKFKSNEEVQKAYVELEKKLGSKQQPAEQNNQAPAEPPKDYDWQKQNAAMDAQEAAVNKRKEEAAAVLGDPANLATVRRVLGNSDAVKQFEQEFNEGHVSASEVKRLLAMGGQVKESTSTIPEPKEQGSQQVSDQDLKYYFQQLKNQSSAYNNSNSPEHKATRARVMEIRQKLGM